MFPSLPCSSLLTLFFSGLIPHLLGDVVFLWGCNLLAHFINAYLVDDSVSDTPGGLGNDQNPGSQVGWNKDLSIFPCTADAQGQGQTRGLWDLSTKVLRARESLGSGLRGPLIVPGGSFASGESGLQRGDSRSATRPGGVRGMHVLGQFSK